MNDFLRGFGAVLPKRWVRAWEIQAHKARMQKALGTSSFQDVQLGTPDIRDQEQTEECFGFATVQGHFIECQAQGIASKLLSPVIPYYEARALLGGSVTDSGSDPDGMVEAWAHYGACEWDQLPFDPNHVNDKPGGLAYRQAQKHRATIEPILEVGTDALIMAIQYAMSVERKPVLIAIDVNPAFMSATGGDTIDDTSGDSLGLHANCLYASHADGAADTANSWGQSWRRRGTATLTPKFLRGRVQWAGALSFEKVAA